MIICAEKFCNLLLTRSTRRLNLSGDQLQNWVPLSSFSTLSESDGDLVQGTGQELSQHWSSQCEGERHRGQESSTPGQETSTPGQETSTPGQETSTPPLVFCLLSCRSQDSLLFLSVLLLGEVGAAVLDKKLSEEEAEGFCLSVWGLVNGF